MQPSLTRGQSPAEPDRPNEPAWADAPAAASLPGVHASPGVPGLPSARKTAGASAAPAGPGLVWRHAQRNTLAAALVASRSDTLAQFKTCQTALPDLQLPQQATLNPPLWELGHIGWFQAHWLGRNPAWRQGVLADPDLPRRPDPRANADALYNSSRVAHASRWSLNLPDAEATQADLARQLSETLTLLDQAHDDDQGLYFFRLALAHEDMHHEAALYMAQALGLPCADARWQPTPLRHARETLSLPAGPWCLGWSGPGFAFDNELLGHAVALPATHIDSRVLSWAEYLPFVLAGGYRQPQWWSDAGQQWLATHGSHLPRYLRHADNDRRDLPDAPQWQQWRNGQWQALDLALPACHLSAYEADAWCQWAGRRLPTEAEWERAACLQPHDMHWGAVWEWTASAFKPYPGFVAHPYRDYSAPWFGSRRVLRGASFMTQPRLQHPRYRNYFTPERNDVPAGFRSCAR